MPPLPKQRETNGLPLLPSHVFRDASVGTNIQTLQLRPALHRVCIDLHIYADSYVGVSVIVRCDLQVLELFFQNIPGGMHPNRDINCAYSSLRDIS